MNKEELQAEYNQLSLETGDIVFKIQELEVKLAIKKSQALKLQAEWSQIQDVEEPVKDEQKTDAVEVPVVKLKKRAKK